MDLKTCKQNSFFLLHLCVNVFISHTHNARRAFISSHQCCCFYVHCSAWYSVFVSLSIFHLPNVRYIWISFFLTYFCLINIYPYLLYFTLLYFITLTFSLQLHQNDLYVHTRVMCALKCNAVQCSGGVLCERPNERVELHESVPTDVLVAKMFNYIRYYFSQWVCSSTPKRILYTSLSFISRSLWMKKQRAKETVNKNMVTWTRTW